MGYTSYMGSSHKPPRPKITMAKLDMIGMPVKDMHTTLEFYRTLGLDIPAGAEKDDHVECKTPEGYRVAWDLEESVKGFNPAYKSLAGSRTSLAFLCDSAADVDALYERLMAKGYRSQKEPWDAFWGQRYALVFDPDGNTVDLFAAL